MKVKSESEVAQSRPTPSDLMDCSPPGPSIHGIFQARVLEWGAIAFSESEHLLGRVNWSKDEAKVAHSFATPWIVQSTEFSRPEYWNG